MKKVTCSLLLLLFLYGSSALGQESAETLVTESAAFLKVFFKNRFDVQVAVVRFENDSELNDTAMQKLYQLLISNLENEKNIRISDLLINFANGRGEFNLGRVDDLHYLLDLKLIQNKSKTGLGLTIFSRLQDKIVSVKYFEKALSKGEMDFLNAKNFAFSKLGFSKLLEFESKRNLMDIQSISGSDGREQYFFYYPDEIVIYLASNMRLEKDSQFKLGWTRPVYPALHYEGKLLLLQTNQGLVLTAGNNFSSYAKVLAFRDSLWQEIQKIDFVPFKYLILNQIPYLVGASYEEGRNYFKDKIYFMPFSDPANRSGIYEKKAAPAMALDFSVQDGQLQAVHLIDRNYNYHLFSAEFEEQFPAPEKKGASLAALGGEWLAVSDYSRASDQLFFYNIQNGGQRPTYSEKITGEIQFISAGVWQNIKGFWTGVRQERDGQERFMVQFWGKRDGQK
ncbi:MAG: hypothetical protein L6428_05355 [Candidatus Aminicenantes bacterium]|nr:hypothetical protein [Acidobacteriota bacterium]MBU4405806.1 hypothetical protein [Acidobacteriota bacterium]MCG2810866.1 hypothetical protein [Candidatus Aminicenantes bacterium]